MNLGRKKIYLEILKENGEAIQYIPFDKRDKEICFEAVKENWQALSYVPKS